MKRMRFQQSADIFLEKRFKQRSSETGSFFYTERLGNPEISLYSIDGNGQRLWISDYSSTVLRESTYSKCIYRRTEHGIYTLTCT